MNSTNSTPATGTKFHLAGYLDAPLKIQGYNTTDSHTASATRCLLGYLFTWILLEDPRQ